MFNVIILKQVSKPLKFNKKKITKKLNDNYMILMILCINKPEVNCIIMG